MEQVLNTIDLEGLVLKADHATYNDYRVPWVKVIDVVLSLDV